MKLLLLRETFSPISTLGTLYANGVKIGYTCEDRDRKLEEVPAAKIHGQTAIPRGKYRVVLSFSNRFQKIMPEILTVPGFSGVRIHGGNTAEDTEGCPLLGSIKTREGVRSCKEVNALLIATLQQAESEGEITLLEIK